VLTHETIQWHPADQCNPQPNANAKLIAAAPDLLAALIAAEDELQRLRHCLDAAVTELDLSVVDKVRSAIINAGSTPTGR
jgi:hypothetical protein